MKAYYLYPEDIGSDRYSYIWEELTKKLGYIEPPASLLLIPLETNQ